MSYRHKSASQLVRVLHICKNFHPVRGGVQVVVERICNGIDSDIRSSVLTTAENKTDSVSQGKYEIIRVKSLTSWFSMPVAPGILWKLITVGKKHDVIVAHYPFPLIELAFLFWPFNLPPIIVYWHSEIVQQRKLAKLVRPLTKVMLSRAKHIVVSSDNLLKYSSLLNGYKSKVSVIPFGCKPRLEEWGDSQDDGFFLAVGRHVPYKGYSVLIEAAAVANVSVRIIGIGPLLEQHRRLAKKLKIDGNVTFVADASDEEVQLNLARCRALVLPSRFPNEAFALVQIEAMALGKPIINTTLKSGVPWVARHLKESISVRPGDTNELTSALMKMNSDPQLRAMLSRNAYARWNKIFTEKMFLDKTLKLYQSVAGV